MRQQVHDPLVGDETDHLVESKAWAPGTAKTADTAVAPLSKAPGAAGRGRHRRAGQAAGAQAARSPPRD